MQNSLEPDMGWGGIAGHPQPGVSDGKGVHLAKAQLWVDLSSMAKQSGHKLQHNQNSLAWTWPQCPCSSHKRLKRELHTGATKPLQEIAPVNSWQRRGT